jgi:hypothetical protein
VSGPLIDTLQCFAVADHRDAGFASECECGATITGSEMIRKGRDQNPCKMGVGRGIKHVEPDAGVSVSKK